MAQFVSAEGYRHVKTVGKGSFGVAYLCEDLSTGEQVILKYVERGRKIDENVERDLINHSLLRHRNIIEFKKVLLTPTHLAIVMEYAAGGELFHRVDTLGRFNEFEARYFFQQLVCGLDYVHRQHVCHRDLKLENTLLDASAAPRLKICDFGYSKSSLLHSQPKSVIGTAAYIAPEVLRHTEYDGKTADVWSCGVALYVMLVGGYPFEDKSDPRNFSKTINKINSLSYSFPEDIPISDECRDLLSKIFVLDVNRRITLTEIRSHPWFLTDCPVDLDSAAEDMHCVEQSLDEIKAILNDAKQLGELESGAASGGFEWEEDETENETFDEDDDDLMGELEREGANISGEYNELFHTAEHPAKSPKAADARAALESCSFKSASNDAFGERPSLEKFESLSPNDSGDYSEEVR